MEKVGDENVVVAGAEVVVEGAARTKRVTIGDAGLLGIFLGDFEDGGPVQRGDLNARIIFGGGDAVHAVAGGDVQDLNFGGGIGIDNLGEDACHRTGHG